MPLPTKEKTWLFSNNNVFTHQDVPQLYFLTPMQRSQRLLMLIKEKLVNWGWTIRGSSDRTTAGLDTVDRWDTLSKIDWQNSRYSWIVLQNPLTGLELMLSTRWVGANYGSITIRISPEAGFSTGTISAMPTAADHINFDFNDPIGANATDTSFVAHIQYSTDGECLRIFCNISGSVVFGAIIDKPSDPVIGFAPYIYSLDSYPQASYSTKANGVFSVQALKNSSTRTYCRLGSANQQLFMTQEVYGNNSLIVDLLASNPNEITSEWPMLPIGLVCAVSGYRGRHGRLADIYWGSTSEWLQDGFTYPADGSRQWIQVGHLIFPWDGSVPVMG